MKEPRIRLILCDELLINLILEGDTALAKATGWNIPDLWSEFGEQIFRFTLDQLKGNPGQEKWYAYLPILIETNTLIGTCGYKGPPDENGFVEIGYEVSQEHRENGYATEMVQMLLNKAFDDAKVKCVIAHTLAHENASTAVLKKNGFTFVRQLEDDEDGTIWRWERNRS